MRLIHLPIEPFEQRYSSDWLRWYREQADENEKFILGDFVYGEIRDGSFLDVTGTIRYKNSQMSKVFQWIEEYRDTTINWKEVVFFFHDLWHPGVTDLFYIRDGLGLPFKIAGMLHAGSYDPHDFLHKKGMEIWAHHIETGWFDNVDLILVATEFHKKMLTAQNRVSKTKIEVTGFPIYPKEQLCSSKKEDMVIFPHRLDSEKRPELFDELMHKIHQSHPNIIGVKTQEYCKTKEEYYNLLWRGKVALSFARQETWGIAMQECVFAGCLPLVPNRLSYTEMYPTVFKYDTVIDELATKVIRMVSTYYSYMKSWADLYNSLSQDGARAITKQKLTMKAIL